MPTRPTIETFDEGAAFRALRATLERPEPIMQGIGALAVRESQRGFREQRFGSVVWKSRGETRMNPNWPGVLADFARGKSNPPSRRWEDAPVLMDSGRLASTISWRVIDGGFVTEVGTMLSYAGALHHGLQSKSVVITVEIQERLWDWIQRSQSGKARAESAPQRREDAEARRSVRENPTVKRLKDELARSQAAYKGQHVPKGEVARRKALRAQIKDAADAADRGARSSSAEVTDHEATRIGKAQRQAAAADALRWLLNPHLRGQQLTITHPARPFVGVPDGLVGEIERALGVRVARSA